MALFCRYASPLGDLSLLVCGTNMELFHPRRIHLTIESIHGQISTLRTTSRISLVACFQPLMKAYIVLRAHLLPLRELEVQVQPTTGLASRQTWRIVLVRW